MRDKQGTKSGYKSIIKRALSRARRSFSTFSNVERTVSKLWYNLCCAQREQEGRSVAVKCNKKRMEKFVRDWERCSCFFSLIVNFRRRHRTRKRKMATSLISSTTYVHLSKGNHFFYFRPWLVDVHIEKLYSFLLWTFENTHFLWIKILKIFKI